MKKLAALALVVALLVVTAVPGLAWADRGFGHRGGFGHPGFRGHGGFHRGFGPRFVHHHGFRSHVFIGVGPAFYPYYYYPPPYYVYTPPPVVVQEPPVYVQQPAQAAPAQPEAYWYYCQSAKAYYPNVQSCGEPWIKVPPRAP
jgi:hypothetical protein